MPSSKTKTSPCSIGFKVPASTLRYGSALIAVTLKPRDFRSRAIAEVATPFPIPEITPPETKMNLVLDIKKHPEGCSPRSCYLNVARLNFLRASLGLSIIKMPLLRPIFRKTLNFYFGPFGNPSRKVKILFCLLQRRVSFLMREFLSMFVELTTYSYRGTSFVNY